MTTFDRLLASIIAGEVNNDEKTRSSLLPAKAMHPHHYHNHHQHLR